MFPITSLLGFGGFGMTARAISNAVKWVAGLIMLFGVYWIFADGARTEADYLESALDEQIEYQETRADYEEEAFDIRQYITDKLDEISQRSHSTAEAVDNLQGSCLDELVDWRMEDGEIVK